jgi:hypothetical protein
VDLVALACRETNAAAMLAAMKADGDRVASHCDIEKNKKSKQASTPSLPSTGESLPSQV